MKSYLVLACFMFTHSVIAQVGFPDSAITLKEIKDRVLIAELIDNYGRFADHRDADKQSGLFTQNGTMEIFRGEPDTSKAEGILKGQAELKNAFSTLSQYNMTYHLDGQKTILLMGDSATGTAYCLAHHIFFENGKRMLMIMGIHYYDKYIRQNGQWYFSDRKLIIDFEDKRLSNL